MISCWVLIVPGNTRHSFIPERHRGEGRRGNTRYSGVNTGWYGLPTQTSKIINLNSRLVSIVIIIIIIISIIIIIVGDVVAEWLVHQTWDLTWPVHTLCS